MTIKYILFIYIIFLGSNATKKMVYYLLLANSSWGAEEGKRK